MLYKGIRITTDQINGRIIGYRVDALRQGYATLELAKAGIRNAIWLRSQ